MPPRKKPTATLGKCVSMSSIIRSLKIQKKNTMSRMVRANEALEKKNKTCSGIAMVAMAQ